MDFSTLLNQLLQIKTDAETKLNMSSNEIKKLKVVQQGFMNALSIPDISFELVKDTEGNKYIMFKQNTNKI